MRRLFFVSLFAALAACHGSSPRAVEPAVAAAEPAESPKPVAEEKRSPELLAKLLAEHDALVAQGADGPTLARIRHAIDRAAAQRDAHVSRLYWYTDLEEAKAAARASGKPILSLRLLGRLDEELSCANSRLFRTTLYANEHVAQTLRDAYVLHWSSERPAPQITLDFGDGRVVRRTITGNSAHYVLDAQGRIVDVLPGLYGPAAFERVLKESLELAKKSADLSDEDARAAVAKYHQRAVWRLTADWRKKLQAAYKDYVIDDYLPQTTLPQPVKFSGNLYHDSLPASVVNVLTMSKADMEAPSLAFLQPEVGYWSSTGDWSKIAALVPREKLDARSRELLRDKHPRDWTTRDARTLDDGTLAKHVEAFEKRVTEEELRNEFAMHGAVHQRMAKVANVDFKGVNDFLYSSLFRTPQSDAWLGLVPTEALTAVEDDGIVKAD